MMQRSRRSGLTLRFIDWINEFFIRIIVLPDLRPPLTDYHSLTSSTATRRPPDRQGQPAPDPNRKHS